MTELVYAYVNQLGAVTIMKTITGKYITILSILFAGALMSSSAIAYNENNNFDHAALAVQYENEAREMQTKVEQQQDILKNKPRTSYLGRNGHRIKKRVMARIQKYEKAAEENFAKADYHTKIAAREAGLDSVAKPGQADGQINKAKKNLIEENSL